MWTANCHLVYARENIFTLKVWFENNIHRSIIKVLYREGICLQILFLLFKSASTIGPGRGGTSYLTDFDETWPVWRGLPKTTSVKTVINASAAVTLLEQRPDKISRLWAGFEPTTSAMPVQCSPNWAINYFHLLQSKFKEIWSKPGEDDHPPVFFKENDQKSPKKWSKV